MIVHAPAPAQRPPWHLRNGAPTVKVNGSMGRGSTTLHGDVRFTAPVQEVEIRTFGAGASDEWYKPSRMNVNAPGMGFHIRSEDLDPEATHADVPDGEVRVEVRFWWDDEERHVLHGGRVADIPDPAIRLPFIERW